jgi:hypothetical protein
MRSENNRLPSQSPTPNPHPLPAITDSPWFWMMLFCGGGLVLLLALSPKYAKRQGRLEMQYHARQETLRRHVEGESAVRPAGQEGSVRPPAPGELIIPLAPLLVLFAALCAISAGLLWRARRSLAAAATSNDAGNGHEGGQR